MRGGYPAPRPVRPTAPGVRPRMMRPPTNTNYRNNLAFSQPTQYSQSYVPRHNINTTVFVDDTVDVEDDDEDIVLDDPYSNLVSKLPAGINIQRI